MKLTTRFHLVSRFEMRGGIRPLTHILYCFTPPSFYPGVRVWGSKWVGGSGGGLDVLNKRKLLPPQGLPVVYTIPSPRRDRAMPLKFCQFSSFMVPRFEHGTSRVPSRRLPTRPRQSVVGFVLSHVTTCTITIHLKILHLFLGVVLGPHEVVRPRCMNLDPTYAKCPSFFNTWMK
jgi:hypothetical protein